MTDEAQNNTAAESSTAGDSVNVADAMFPSTAKTAQAGDDDNKEKLPSDNTDEGKKAEEKPADDADKADDEDKSDDDADESKDEDAVDYESLKLPELPEGMEVDNELYGQIKDIGQKHKIPPEAMQEMINTYADRIAGADEALKGQWETVEKGWKESAKNDKEIGGDNFDSSVSKAKKAIDRFGTPALKEALEQTRVGNHPEIIRFMTRIGDAISEGGAFDTGGNTGTKSRSDVLYDNS